jgi:hypothetical protein
MTETTSQVNTEDRLDVRAMMERWTESRRKATERFLELYQTSVGQMADAHVKTARAVDLPAVVQIAETQAAVSRDVADAYVTSVRKLLDH